MCIKDRYREDGVHIYSLFTWKHMLLSPYYTSTIPKVREYWIRSNPPFQNCKWDVYTIIQMSLFLSSFAIVTPHPSAPPAPSSYRFWFDFWDSGPSCVHDTKDIFTIKNEKLNHMSCIVSYRNYLGLKRYWNSFVQFKGQIQNHKSVWLSPADPIYTQRCLLF